jgi:hypothetical protein
MSTKLVELFANRVVERRNMINDYLRGRVCIENVRGNVGFELLCILNICLEFGLSLALVCHFAWLCRFSCRLLTFVVFLLLDDILELFLTFWVF